MPCSVLQGPLKIETTQQAASASSNPTHAKMKHHYNVTDSMKEVMSVITSQPEDPLGKIAAIVGAVTVASSPQHRAILRMRPVLCEEMAIALETAINTLYVCYMNGGLTEAVFQVYINSAIAAQGALALPASIDCGMRFIAYKDGKEYMGQVDEDGMIVSKIVAGEYVSDGVYNRHISGESWANQHAIARKEVCALVEDGIADAPAAASAEPVASHPIIPPLRISAV